MHTPISWKMKSIVNNETFEFHGEGFGDSSTGVCDMQFKSTGFPEGFDPVSCPNICNAPTTSCFARTNDDFGGLLELCDAYSVSPSRIGRVHDSEGKELLHLEVTSDVQYLDGRLVVVNEMNGFSHLPPLERNLVPIVDFLIPAGRGEATGVIRFKLLTKSGEVLHGSTVVPYKWTSGKSLPSLLSRRIEAMDVAWDGRNSVSARVQSVWQPFVEANEHLELEVG